MPAAPHDTLPDPYHANRVWRTFQFLMQNVFVFWMDYRSRGAEHLPRSGALILANHQSFLDPLLIGVGLDRPVSFLARSSLFRVPVIGWILRNTYVMPINRDTAGTESIREGVRRMEHGFLVGIFPEGTRTRDGRIGVMKPGFISLVRRAQVPVVPAGIAGAGQAMPRGALIPRAGSVRVVFGEPLSGEELERLRQRGNETEFVARVRERIQECVNQAESWRRADRFSGVAE
jgi:1-acyl-sn-glycerol-3-phosphate acyltransferase